VILKLNAQNLAGQMDLICHVKSNGAGFTNGIGDRKSLPISNKSVTGTVLTENYITVNPNGTEASQQHAVIILTDAAKNLLNIPYLLNLQNHLPHERNSTFNPFIIANKSEKRNSFTLFKTYNFR
jgi:LruC domain-containing protein